MIVIQINRLFLTGFTSYSKGKSFDFKVDLFDLDGL